MTNTAAVPEDLIASYRTALETIGRAVNRDTLRPAREFGVAVGDVETWQRLDADAQAALSSHVRGFVSWLLITGRTGATPAYLAVAKPQLSNIAIAHLPELWASFADTATDLGVDEIEIKRQWQVLVALCALEGIPVACAFSDERRLRNGAEAFLAAHPVVAPSRDLGHRRLVRLLWATLTAMGAASPTIAKPEAVTAPGPRGAGPNRVIDWDNVPSGYARTARRYLNQLRVTQQASSVKDTSVTLRDFGGWALANTHAVGVAELRRDDIERYKEWLHTRPSQRGGGLHDSTIAKRLAGLRSFFERITEWEWDDAPTRRLVYSGDLPSRDKPLPRFLGDGDAAKLLRAARAHPDPLVGFVVEFLARTGMRRSELLLLATDAVTQIGDAYWLRIPIGKLRTDRYIPLHPQLKELLDNWIEQRPECITTNRLLVENGTPIPYGRIGLAVTAAATAAGLGRVTPHQLRHTLATQAINRGMSLEAIAALLGHTSMNMTMVYARIADRTVAEEYFAVSEQVESLYDQPALPATVEGSKMRKLRAEVTQRMLGNGYCTRPVELDCQFETICESCTYFATAIEFRPRLQRQRDDAAERNDQPKAAILDQVLNTLDEAG